VAEYRILLSSSAKRELLRLPDPVIARILPKIEGLATQPRPHGCKKLRGGEDEWRIRIGDYRVIYSIDDGAQLVDVSHIAHRRDVYE
jgi:mRNA interferase RelE/StbE